ncbi:MAG: flagellar biosynthesis anti-sigma factor FlgM [Acidobacteriaceae bacterium]|nr:flagellar biosynthesis anti-sigma factor FlgM [Acidobacteriaceae bacterium]
MTGINNLQSLFGATQSSSTALVDTTATRSVATAQSTTAVAGNALSEQASTDQTVALSSAGNALSQVGKEDDVNTAKVAQLQAAIAAGTYNVSSSDVADKMMQSILNGR